MSNLKRLQMNIHKDMLYHLNVETTKEGVKITDLILPFVSEYLKERGVEVNPVWLMAPKHWDDE